MAITELEPQQPYRKSPMRKRTIEESVRITEYATTVLMSTPSNGGRMANLQSVHLMR